MKIIKATEEDIKNNVVFIDVEALMSSMLESSSKEYVEELYLKVLGLTKEVAEVIWEDDKIIGFKPIKPCEYVSFTITVDKNNIKIR